MSDEESNWVFFEVMVGDDHAFFRVDAGVRERAPDASLSYALGVRVPLNNPREDGLVTPQEAQVLSPYEAALEAALAPSPFVGTTVYGGARTWYFYTSDPRRDAIAARKTGEELIPEHTVTFDAYDDPEWGTYTDFLYPNPMAWRYIGDCQVLESLAKHGDDGSAPRCIDHWAHFPSEENRSAFVGQLGEQGYEVVTMDRWEDADNPFAVQFKTTQDMPPADVIRTNERLFLLAQECDGVYDGWECPVFKDGENDNA